MGRTSRIAHARLARPAWPGHVSRPGDAAESDNSINTTKGTVPLSTFTFQGDAIMRKSKLGILASAVLMGSMAIPVLAQAPAGGGGGGGGGFQGGGGGGGGGGGFQNFRQRMIDQMKADLGSTDDEFAALQPKIEAVMAAQRD